MFAIFMLQQQQSLSTTNVSFIEQPLIRNKRQYFKPTFDGYHILTDKQIILKRIRNGPKNHNNNIIPQPQLSVASIFWNRIKNVMSG